MERKNIIVLEINGEKVGSWGSLTEICEQYKDLPYHTLKSLKFPILHKEYALYKLPFRPNEGEILLRKQADF